MNILLLSIFLVQSIIFSVWCFKKYKNIFTPFSFFHFSYVGIVLFGYIGLVFIDPTPFSQKTIFFTMLYAIFLQLAAFLGYVSKKRILPKTIIKFVFPKKNISNRNALRIGIAYCLIGFYFFYKYYSLPPEVLLSEHSGIAVLYVVFAKILYVGYAVLLVIAIKENKKSIKFITFLIFAAIFSMLLIRLKRTETLIFISSTLIILFYLKGFKLSRKIILIGGISFFGFVMYIGEIREIINFSFIKGDEIKIEKLANLNEDSSLLEKTFTSPELKWGISQIQVSSIDLNFSYGMIHWNRLINLFIPAQLVGVSLKEGMKFELPKYDIYSHFGVETYRNGLMNTLLAETFKEFWIFGILFIFIIFNVIKSIISNIPKYNYTYYIVFVALITPYAVVISGSGTSLYLGGCLFYYIYLMPFKMLK